MAQVQAQAEHWVPTVNDLRVRTPIAHDLQRSPYSPCPSPQVKLCYICREEERYDSQSPSTSPLTPN